MRFYFYFLLVLFYMNSIAMDKVEPADFSSPKFCSVYQSVVGGAALPKADELPSLYKIMEMVPKFAPKINIKLGIYYLSTGNEREAIPLLNKGLENPDGFMYAKYVLSDDDEQRMTAKRSVMLLLRLKEMFGAAL